MDYGVHLPLIDFDGERFTLDRLQKYASMAESLGFQALAANDHLIFSRPWFDGPTALAAVVDQAKHMALMTSVSLPVVRGPAALAKTLAAVDILSGGRLIVGVGPGSSVRDYDLVGLPFEERWKRLDEALEALRAYWKRESRPFQGRFYTTEDTALEPYPVHVSGLPIWIGSWGSEAGLRRTARLGDGWLASAYNTTPERFASAWEQLKALLPRVGKSPERFPNVIATMFMYVTEVRDKSEQVIREMLSPTINRSEDDLRECLLVGSAEACAEKLAAYRDAGVQRVLLWPVTNELHQLETFQEKVMPLIP